MWSCVSRQLGGLVALCGLLAAACYDARVNDVEQCNYEDDNRDGRIDETFVNAAGAYDQVDHCGGCGVDCAAVFPSAEAVSCVASPKGYACRIDTCPDGTHLVGDAACVANQAVACLTCTADEDCTALSPGSVCRALSSGDRRCLDPCGPGQACPDGFYCESAEDGAHCLPSSGHCGCTPETAGQPYGCWIETPNRDRLCQGIRLCEGWTFSECLSLQKELCDGEDNDCNGQIDEGFMSDGMYLSAEHCGACNRPCEALAPNTTASCENIGGAATCVRECADHYVDLDGLALNGCECFKVSSVWPPRSLGGDMDCDGQTDETGAFVFVSKAGDDANAGTLDAPVETIARGIALAEPEGLTVVVAQGIYLETVRIAAGVSLFGGYRTDFGDNNPDAFQVRVEGDPDTPGLPALVAANITSPTEVSGVTIVGSEGDWPGAGSTAAYIWSSTGDLLIHDLKILSGNGIAGADGPSSSEQLQAATDSNLADLDGAAGGSGDDGIDARTAECTDIRLSGGHGGEKVCPLSDENVSGGSGGDATCPDTGCEEDMICPNAGCDDFMTEEGCDFEAMLAAALPNPEASDGSGEGRGRAGPFTYDAPTTRDGSNFCADDPSLRRDGGGGGNGRDGADGEGGEGCRDASGVFQRETGAWSNLSGKPGTMGGDGGGGGGGTQGNGYDVLSWNTISATFTDRIGGAGGGGGSGGCGAPGAVQGQGGGSVIGVAIVLTETGDGPTVENVRVTPGRAGDGGSGGRGAAGGLPGPGGAGGEGNYWCARRGGRGGDGGAGGAGGGGGGGCGGSISGFHVVVPPGVDAAAYRLTLLTRNHVDPMPAPGKGGTGGFSPGSPGRDGLAGTAEPFRLYPLSE